MQFLDNVLQYIENSDGDEAAVLSWMRRHQNGEHDDVAITRQHEGSQANRRPNKAREFEEVVQRILRDYFNDDCVYGDVEFQRRFRMPRSLFTRVFERISIRHFFVRKTDALGRLDVHPLQRITAALRVMAYGISSDAVDEYCRLSESSTMDSLKGFTKAVVEEFGPEYLRSPTEKDLQRLLRINTSRGFPGMVASIDCQPYEWKACPTGQAGAHKGKGNKPSVVLEGMADG